jgi:hypothetical protein
VKVVCAWCRAEGISCVIGEREPLDDPQETHGICRRHAERVAGFLPGRSFPGVRLLLIVDSTETKLFRYLEGSFERVRDVKVMFERRLAERRQHLRPDRPSEERRRGERRLRTGVVSPLGYRIVRFGPGTPAGSMGPSSSPRR